jgi:hypothetical protein
MANDLINLSKWPKHYKFLNLSQQISTVDLELKSDLIRRFAKLSATLQHPLKLKN